MKNAIKILFLVIIFSSQFACNNDDDSANTAETSIVGEWLRSDYNVDTNFEYKLHFLGDNTNGMITEEQSTEDGIISNAIPFNWSLNTSILTITKDNNEEITTTYQFSQDGNVLLLTNFSDLEFIRQ
ncbi:hypothetical protein [Lacinutrix salivirga]